MPRITISWAEGRSIEQKKKIAEAFTKIIVEVAKVSESAVSIYFYDLPKTNISRGRDLLSYES